MHLWHELEIGDVDKGEINAIIEISAKSKVKYELDKETGLIMVDRILSSSMVYPQNYGFLPQTYCDDGDPLDVIVFSQCSFIPGALLKIKVIGAIKMLDQEEQDDKLIAIHIDDPAFSHVTEIDDIPSHQIEEIKNFFETYKLLENKKTSIEAVVPRKEAEAIIKKAIEDYQKNY